MICFATDLAGLSRGPLGEADVRLLSLGFRVGEYCGLGPGMRAIGTSSSTIGRGGGGAGRCGWRYPAVDTERLRDVCNGKGTGLSSMGGGKIGAPGKSTFWLCVLIRAMMVLALADVSFSCDENVPRGVDEPECSFVLTRLDKLNVCGMLLGEHGGDSGRCSSP